MTKMIEIMMNMMITELIIVLYCETDMWQRRLLLNITIMMITYSFTCVIKEVGSWKSVASSGD